MVPSFSNCCKSVFLRWVVMWILLLAANLPAVTMTRSSGLTLGLVMYLSLLKTVEEILVALVYFIQIFRER